MSFSYELEGVTDGFQELQVAHIINDNDRKDNNNDKDISIRIAPATINNNVYDIVLELYGSDKRGRCPVDICAVLDTSGSMCTSASVADDNGIVENDDGLSILDLVKHSVKTVINCLNSNDRFSIVSFENKAKLEYGLNYMNENNKKYAINALEQLQPAGQTNLWDGLYKGLESLRTKKDITDNRLSVIMLLTDGIPTIIPPKGHIHELTKYIDQNNLCECIQINTFGFGYDLDSELLHSLAVYGNGTFAFIPDAKIIGTTFVNSISNILTTINAKTKLYLTAMNGSKFIGESYGAYKEQDESWGRIIDIGPIMCGSTRYISLPMSVPNNNKPYLECLINIDKINNIICHGVQRTICNNLLAGHLTAKTVSIGLKATDLTINRQGNAAIKLIKALKEYISTLTNSTKNMDTDDFDQMTANSRLEALDNDVKGRFSKAFEGEKRFNRWGKHYLRALLRAHQLNMCTNFMDPGLQVNGGNLFRELQAKGDEAFKNLPSPNPSRRTGSSQTINNYNNNNNNNNKNNKNNNNNNNNNNKYTIVGGNSRRRRRCRGNKPTVNMANYYRGATGGCFAPYCTVNVLEKNTKQCVTKQVCDVRPGDMVGVVGGEFATVIFKVELARDRKRRMIKFPQTGLVITGGHPVRRNKLWCLPREQNDIQFTTGCDTVFTFVLDQSHVIIVNGMECITWAHGLNDVIVNHSFFGTNKVIEALKQKTMNIDGVDGVDVLNNVIAVYHMS